MTQKSSGCQAHPLDRLQSEKPDLRDAISRGLLADVSASAQTQAMATG